jgi:hypothetical protein
MCDLGLYLFWTISATHLEESGSFLEVFKFTTPIVKIIMCWTWMLNLLENPYTDLL